MRLAQFFKRMWRGLRSGKRGRSARASFSRLQLEPLEERTLLSADFGFATQFGGGGWSAGDAITTDARGNVYVTGSQPGFFERIFVRKYSPAGQLQWEHRVGGIDTICEGRGIAVDHDGNVY